MTQNRDPRDLEKVEENESTDAPAAASSAGESIELFVSEFKPRSRAPSSPVFKDEEGCEKPEVNIIVEEEPADTDIGTGKPLIQDEGAVYRAAQNAGTSDQASASDHVKIMELEESDFQKAFPGTSTGITLAENGADAGTEPKLSPAARAIGLLLGNLIIIGVPVCAIVAALFFFCGKPILAALDRLCCQNSYSAIPVGRLMNPFLSSSRQERESYEHALAKVRDGLNREIFHDYFNAARRYREALRQIEKLQDKDQPLRAYIYLRLGSCENHAIPIPAGAEFQSVRRQAENDLLQSKALVSSLVSPDNFVVAMAEREVARVYIASELLTAGHGGVVPAFAILPIEGFPAKQNSKDSKIAGNITYSDASRPIDALVSAQRMVQAALLLDLKGNHGPAAAVMEDQELLSSIYMQAHDYTLADRAWSEYLSQCKILKGEQSLYYARGLIDHATHLAMSQRLPESISFAKQAMKSLTAPPLICVSNWLEPAITKETIANSIRTYLAIVRKLQSDEIAKLKNSDEFLLSVNDLEDALIKWGGHNYSRRAQFDQLVSLADGYNYAGSYTQADHLYKKALLLQTSNSTKRKWQNQSVSDWYVLCMAKTAKNDLQRGAIKEAATIGANCLRIINPYDSWIPYQHHFKPVVEQLVFGFGPAQLQSVEVKKIVTELRSLLEISSPGLNDSDRLVYLAELEELQGNMYRAECAYKEAAEQQMKLNQSRRSPHAAAVDAIAALAAFYEKEGRHELAGPLFEQAERSLRADGTTWNQGTLINLARLKRLLSLSADQSVFAPYEWWRNAKLDIAKSRTSYELAYSSYLIDLRPLISDFRTDIRSGAGLAGFGYSVRFARADLSKLSESQRKLAREQFKWYDFCFPSNPEKSREILAKESLSAEAQPDMLSRPHSPAELIPDKIMIVSNKDGQKLEKLLGHKSFSGP